LLKHTIFEDKKSVKVVCNVVEKKKIRQKKGRIVNEWVAGYRRVEFPDSSKSIGRRELGDHFSSNKGL